MDLREKARRARAAERASWPIERVPLEEERAPVVSSQSPSERFAMVWAITMDTWALRGEPLPSYTRGEIPGRLIRRNE